MSGESLRIALVSADRGEHLTQLAAGLRERGHEVALVTPRGATRRAAELLDAVLARRGFTRPLAHVPSALRALRRGRFDVAHAFSPADAWATRRCGAALTVFTCRDPVDRANVADRRLRLVLLSGAVEGCDEVVVPDSARRAALERWFAHESTVLGETDSAGHEELYRRGLRAG